MCGWLKRGDGSRLALEARAELRVGRELRRQHLDRDHAIEPRVARLVDLAHPAGATEATQSRNGRAERRD